MQAMITKLLGRVVCIFSDHEWRQMRPVLSLPFEGLTPRWQRLHLQASPQCCIRCGKVRRFV